MASVPVQTNLNDWKTIASLGSSYKKFDDKHKDDVTKLEKAQSTGNIDSLMLRNTAQSWSNTLNQGISDLTNQSQNPTDKKSQQVVKEVLKDLNKAKDSLTKLVPQAQKGQQPSILNTLKKDFENGLNYIYDSLRHTNTPRDPLPPKEICAPDCSPQIIKNRYNMTDIAKVNVNTEKIRCCVTTVFFDDNIVEKTTIPAQIILKKSEALQSLSNIILYYNTRKEFLDTTVAPTVKKQVTVLELIPRNYSPLFIPFEYLSVFPALHSMIGVYTSNFSYMFKYISHVKNLWIPNFTTSVYFDNNQNRIIQFLDMPNLQDIHITKKLSNDEDSSEIVYNIYINNLPKLESFENSTDLAFDSIRLYNVNKCKYIQNKMFANQIDIRSCASINNLDLIVDKMCIIFDLPNLKMLNIKLNQDNVVLKLKGIKSLETLIIKGNVNLGNSNKHIVFDHGSMHNLRTFVIEGELISNSQKLVDSFVYEIIRNNKLLTHISINGKSFTGKDLYEQYKQMFSQLPILVYS
jgi:hypothetical protein